MAIRTENITINDAPFVRTYSDAGRAVVRDGISYAEAIDPADLAPARVYTEGDIIPDETTDEDYAEAGRILMGVG